MSNLAGRSGRALGRDEYARTWPAGKESSQRGSDGGSAHSMRASESRAAVRTALADLLPDQPA
ncbi:hypothetical protein [Planobispora takensis]|nr:hypothetical protein [Planobispora takensis]